MEVLACLNGETMPVEQARVPVWDRGFLFGDSVYEVFRMYRGRCWLETEHLARLRRSLKELEFPPHDLDRLVERMYRTIAASGIQEGTVYVQITRGVAPRSHAFPDPPVPPTELIVVRPYDDGPTARLRETGVRVISHPDLRWKRCDIKTTNLLGNVLANEKAHRAGCYEADPDRFGGIGDRGDPHFVTLGAARAARGDPRGPRDPAGNDPATHPPTGREDRDSVRSGASRCRN